MPGSKSTVCLSANRTVRRTRPLWLSARAPSRALRQSFNAWRALPGYFSRFGARLVHSTTLIDRAYQRFDRLRSLVVLAFASDTFLDAHGHLAYDATTAYRADSPDF